MLPPYFRPCDLAIFSAYHEQVSCFVKNTVQMYILIDWCRFATIVAESQITTYYNEVIIYYVIVGMSLSKPHIPHCICMYI